MDLPRYTPRILDGVHYNAGLTLLEGGESISLIVGSGDDTKHWTLPKELLTHHSPFFAGALNGSFTEASAKKVNLPEDDPRVLSSFIRWLYTGKVGPVPNAILLAKAWMLGDKLGCSVFADRAMFETLCYHQKSCVKAATIERLQEQSTVVKASQMGDTPVPVLYSRNLWPRSGSLRIRDVDGARRLKH